jgi:predicted ATPase/class 3 adenylate cyclase
VSRLDAAVLFVDAVGFTARSSALVEAGPDGVERLSALLDAHYAPILDAVEQHGGEVVRFVGDALIALMPAQGRTLEQATAAAIACAHAVQGAPRAPMPDSVPLAVSAVVTAGPIVVLRDVGERTAHFVVTGAPLDELARWPASGERGRLALGASAARVPAATPRDPGLVSRGYAGIDADRSGLSVGPEPHQLRWIERFVPPPVLERIDSGHLDWLAELRRVTAVFVAIRALDADRAPGVLAEARLLAERHEAFLKELVLDDKGWTLVALTGVPPFARTDDPARAVRVARELVASLGRLGLRASAGVATGRAFCGLVGSARRREYAVAGLAMNLASRLSQRAERDCVLCDEETVRVAGRDVAFERPAQVAVKGLPGPVAVSVAGGDVTARSRDPLVGRDEERLLLSRAVAEAAARRPAGTLVLEGEPGVGKSHLVGDLLEQARSEGLVCWVGAGQAESRAAAYHPWRAVIGAATGGDVERAAGPVDASLAPLLEAILPCGLRDNEVTAPLAGQLRAQRTRELCVRLLSRAASVTPALLLIEDLHWADAASWDLLRAVAAAAAPGLLVVATARPEAQASLSALEGAGVVRRRLDALPQQATAALLTASLGVREVEPALALRLHERAGGNPLFVQQLALSLVESNAVQVSGGRCAAADGVDVATIALPPTVEGAITARLDRLTPAAQLALKVAAVIGLEFAPRALAAVHPDVPGASPLEAQIDALRAAQLLDVDEDGTHRFRHELVRDVAYGAMLFEQRRALHGDVASWYEREHARDLAPCWAVLAYHHRAAGNVDRAVDYLELDAARTFSIGLARQSVAIGVDAAALLGVDLRGDGSAVAARIGALVGETAALLGGRSLRDLLALPSMQGGSLRTVRLLLELAPFTFQAGRPELYALIGLTLLKLVLEEGNAAPDVYSTYSVVHRALHHDAAGAYAWSELARALDDRQGGAARARVAFVHGWFHSHWVRPLRESLPASLSAAEDALASGDVLFGCYNLSAHVVYRAAAGAPLGDVIDVASAHLARNGRRVVNAAFHCLHEMQVAKALAGRTRAPLSLSDDELDEERDIAWICASDLYNQIGYYIASRVKLHALFGDARGALEWAEKVAPLHAAIAGQVAEIDLVFYGTLARLDMAFDPEHHERVASARVAAHQVAGWAARCPANFAHLADLLGAAVAAEDGRRDEALAGYARAAERAEAEGFVQHAAIAHERAARLLTGADARARLDKAIDAYRRWGALAKVGALSR